MSKSYFMDRFATAQDGLKLHVRSYERIESCLTTGNFTICLSRCD
jgi:hypothetical protein